MDWTGLSYGVWGLRPQPPEADFWSFSSAVATLPEREGIRVGCVQLGTSVSLDLR